jgi:hypothetical protein
MIRKDTTRIEKTTLGEGDEDLMPGLVFAVFILVLLKASFFHNKVMLKKIPEGNIISRVQKNTHFLSRPQKRESRQKSWIPDQAQNDEC